MAPHEHNKPGALLALLMAEVFLCASAAGQRLDDPTLETKGDINAIFYQPLSAELYLDSITDAQTLSLFYDMVEDFTLRSIYLTDEDYSEVAAELGVDIAAIKAVVDIETGRKFCGFWQEGKPIINFDLSIYRQYARRHNVDLKKAKKEAPIAFKNPDVKRYGSKQAAQYARLDDAKKVNEELALESCFWGMFQIGGFNYHKCGCRDVHEFVARMSRSEREQLELFAAYCQSRDLVKYIRNHQWAEFAKRYNGPGYKKHKYDSRMAAAYKKYSQ